MRVPSVHRVSAVGDVVYEFISRCIHGTFFFISGMVQICCACNDKNANHAEGGTSNSIDGRFTPSDNKSVANSDSSIVRFKVHLLIHLFALFSHTALYRSRTSRRCLRRPVAVVGVIHGLIHRRPTKLLRMVTDNIRKKK